jgi:hypothetical protein
LGYTQFVNVLSRIILSPSNATGKNKYANAGGGFDLSLFAVLLTSLFLSPMYKVTMMSFDRYFTAARPSSSAD